MSFVKPTLSIPDIDPSEGAYEDVLRDIGHYLFYDLPCGGLSACILMGRPFHELREVCHTAVSDAVLQNTIALVYRNISVRENKLVGNWRFWRRWIMKIKEPDSHNAS